MSLSAILVMSFITIVLGFACLLVVDDAMRHSSRNKESR